MTRSIGFAVLVLLLMPFGADAQHRFDQWGDGQPTRELVAAPAPITRIAGSSGATKGSYVRWALFGAVVGGVLGHYIGSIDAELDGFVPDVRPIGRGAALGAAVGLFIAWKRGQRER